MLDGFSHWHVYVLLNFLPYWSHYFGNVGKYERKEIESGKILTSL